MPIHFILLLIEPIIFFLRKKIYTKECYLLIWLNNVIWCNYQKEVMDSLDMNIYKHTKYIHFKNIYHVQFHVQLTCTESINSKISYFILLSPVQKSCKLTNNFFFSEKKNNVQTQCKLFCLGVKTQLAELVDWP